MQEETKLRAVQVEPALPDTPLKIASLRCPHSSLHPPIRITASNAQVRRAGALI
jgi:hypothetical protein